MKWFTADLHLGHKNILKYCKRPFKDTKEMQDELARRWDVCVKPGDEVYIVGDLGFDPKVVASFLGDRPGQKFIAWGNHDPKKNSEKAIILGAKGVVLAGPLLEIDQTWEEFDDVGETVLVKQKIVLCHYPMYRWNKSHLGSWMLHGHEHGGINLDPFHTKHKILDVGVDCWAYAPVSFDEIKNLADCGMVTPHHSEED